MWIEIYAIEHMIENNVRIMWMIKNNNVCNEKYSEIEKRLLTERIELLSEQFLNTKETHTK